MDEIKISDDVYEQIKDFPKSGLLTKEQRSLIDRLILNEELKKRYLSFCVCKMCKQPNTGHYSWCQPCVSDHFQPNFKSWTSGNNEVDKLIQKAQLEAK